MNLRQLKQLGKSDVWVTQLGLGGTGLGGMYAAVDSGTAIATATAAYEAGVRIPITLMTRHTSTEKGEGTSHVVLVPEGRTLTWTNSLLAGVLGVRMMLAGSFH